jgi:hypothetical protein
VFDAMPPTPVTPDNAAGHVLFGLSGCRARLVLCAGRVLLRDGVPTRVDEGEITARARRRAEALWVRLRD